MSPAISFAVVTSDSLALLISIPDWPCARGPELHLTSSRHPRQVGAPTPLSSRVNRQPPRLYLGTASEPEAPLVWNDCSGELESNSGDTDAENGVIKVET